MGKFIEKDRVKCVGMDPIYREKLIVGRTYTVRNTFPVLGGDKWISVYENAGGYAYECSYFELSDKPLTPLQKVLYGIND